jgi:hypothetical protein
MAQEINVTGTTPKSLGIVDSEKQGMSVIVRLAGDLDSGTITIGTRPSGGSGQGVIEILDATLVLGGSATYTVGQMMELFATQSGASSDVNYLVSQY